MPLYLITGGAGFIGSHIAKRLVKDGESVRIFDNFSTGKMENLEEIRDSIDLREADLRDADAVKNAMKGVDYVFHEAALASVPRSIVDPVASNEVNITGTLHLLDAATKEKVKRFVFASSSSVYGDQEGDFKREDMVPNPLSPYAVTKHVGEQYGHVFHKLHGLPYVAIRYFNVFGSFQDEKSDYAAVIPIWAKRLLTGEAPVIFGDGKQSRDFTHISNVVQANILATQREEAVGKSINVACGGSFDLNFLAEQLAKALGVDRKPEYAEARPGDVKHSKADITLARKALGYEPAIGFDEGLVETARWYTARLASTSSRQES